MFNFVYNKEFYIGIICISAYILAALFFMKIFNICLTKKAQENNKKNSAKQYSNN